jgi:hypothetical protein
MGGSMAETRARRARVSAIEPLREKVENWRCPLNPRGEGDDGGKPSSPSPRGPEAARRAGCRRLSPGHR